MASSYPDGDASWYWANVTHNAVRSVLLDQFPSEKTNDMSCSFCSGMFLPKNI